MVVDGAGLDGWGGRRSWPGLRGWPSRHLGGRWPVAQGRVGPARVVVPTPGLDQPLGLPQSGEDLASEQLVPELVWVTPIERTAASMV